MHKDDEFIADLFAGNAGQSKRVSSRHKVIKSSQLSLGKPRKIIPRSEEEAGPGQGNLFPIVENDEIIGFTYECSCGSVAKIIFDYGQETQAAAG